MRRTFGIGLTVAVLALAVGCGKKDGTTGPGGPGGIEGGWTLVGYEAGGKKSTEAEIAALPAADKKIKATPDKLVKTKERKEESLVYKIDHSKTPNEIDLTETKDGTTDTSYGICKLEGDILTICLVPSSNPADRPKEFKTAAGSKAVIMTLKKD